MAKHWNEKMRSAAQLAATLLQNADFKGFFTGKISDAATKNVCVPGLNCYSCPGAVAGCPMGALQTALSAYKFRFPYYVVGLLLFFGALLGRFICGFLCPMGFLQDLLHKIPLPKGWKKRTFRGDRLLRKVKYAILLLFVIILPLCVKLTPWFCKYICPSGTVSALLLALADHSLLSMFGSRFAWKCCVLGMIVLASLVILRPFCKYLCPLGALYGLCNPISVVRLRFDSDRCIHCGACGAACGMQVDPTAHPNSAECIRCGKCVSVCPEKALRFGSILNNNKEEQS